MSGDRTLGTLPIDRPLSDDSFLIFGGQRWRVINVDMKKKMIQLKPAKGGKPPKFGGNAGCIENRIRQEMLKVYKGADMPRFMDVNAMDMFNEGRDNFNRYGLNDRSLISHVKNSLLFPWAGDRVMDTLMIQLQTLGLKASHDGIAITVLNIKPKNLLDNLKRLRTQTTFNTQILASVVKNKMREKYDHLLTEELLCAQYASRYIDMKGALEVLNAIVRD